jgi:putative MATE family efflux protein
VKVQRAIDTTIIFLIISALFVTIVGLIFCDSLLQLIRTPTNVFDGARVYMQIMLIGLLPLFGFNCLAAILRGLGDSKTPLYAMLISSSINVVVSLIFVANLGLGIAGAGWATVIAQTVTMIGLIIWLNAKHPIIKITLRKLIFDFDIFRNSIRIGLPNGIQQVTIAMGMMAILGIVNKFAEENSDVLVAYTIVNRIDTIVLAPAMAFSMAIAAFVGQNIGAQKLYRIPKGLSSALLMSAAVTIIFSIILIALSTPLIKMFSTEITDGAIVIGKRYLWIICSFTVLFSTMFIITGLMRGAGDSFAPMVITLLAMWIIRIPVASILSKIIGVDGIWWSIPITWLFGTICSVFYYRTGRWKNKGVVPLES